MIQAVTQGLRDRLLAMTLNIFFNLSTWRRQEKTQMIMTQERRSVETSGWDGGPRADAMLGTADEVLISSAL